MPFAKGVSGNPKGRPKGQSRSLSVRKVMTDLLEKDGPELMRVAKRLAKNGDTAMLIALLDRAVPRLKPVQVMTGAPLNPALTDGENRAALMGAMAEGALSIDDGTALLGALKLGPATGGVLSIYVDLGLPAPAPLILENEA